MMILITEIECILRYTPLAPIFQVEVCRIAGQFPQERFADTLSESSSDSTQSREDEDIQNSTVTVRVSACICKVMI